MIFGVIGVGSMGKNHVRVLTEIKKVNNVVVYDVDLNRARDVAEMYEVDVVSSEDELLQKVDAVSVCSPTALHYSHIRKCVEAGKHTFVEKPMAPSYEEGQKISEILKNSDVVFGVGNKVRFNPIVGELHKLVLVIKYIDVKRHNPTSGRIRDSTVIEDLMIHDIDVVFNVLFPDATDFKLSAAGNNDVVQVLVNLDSSVVSLSASRISSKKIRKIYIESYDMTVEGDYMTQELFIFKKPNVYQSINEGYRQENVMEKVLISKVEPLKVELKAFVDAIDKGTEFPVTAEQALKNLKICDLIRRSVA